MTAPEEKAAQIVAEWADAYYLNTAVAAESAALVHAISTALKAERDAGRREGLSECEAVALTYYKEAGNQYARNSAWAVLTRVRKLADAGKRVD